jgi:hypothetical protein
MSSTQNCTFVSPDCPVEATIYGFTPNLAINIFFCAAFGTCALLQFIQGLTWKTYPYTTTLILGCIAESIGTFPTTPSHKLPTNPILLGYVGRILLNHNPWSDPGFKIQIVCLIIAPAFLSAGIYLTLRQLVLALDSELSRIKPRLYTWIFITCDVVSIVLQGVGGGLAAGRGW